MATILLNPGCGPCNGCEPCPQCTDYYDPDTWYFWLDDIQPSPYDSPSSLGLTLNSQAFILDFQEYYWDSSDLHTVLNDLLISFQFPLTEPTIFAGDYKGYRVTNIPLTGVTASATAMIRHGTPPVVDDVYTGRSDWTPSTVNFFDFVVTEVIIRDYCDGSRIATMKLEFKYSWPGYGYSSVLLRTSFIMDLPGETDCAKPIMSAPTAKTFVTGNSPTPGHETTINLIYPPHITDFVLVRLPLEMTGSGLVFFNYTASADTTPP